MIMMVHAHAPALPTSLVKTPTGYRLQATAGPGGSQRSRMADGGYQRGPEGLTLHSTTGEETLTKRYRLTVSQTLKTVVGGYRKVVIINGWEHTPCGGELRFVLSGYSGMFRSVHYSPGVSSSRKIHFHTQIIHFSGVGMIEGIGPREDGFGPSEVHTQLSSCEPRSILSSTKTCREKCWVPTGDWYDASSKSLNLRRQMLPRIGYTSRRLEDPINGGVDSSRQGEHGGTCSDG